MCSVICQFTAKQAIPCLTKTAFKDVKTNRRAALSVVHGSCSRMSAHPCAARTYHPSWAKLSSTPYSAWLTGVRM